MFKFANMKLNTFYHVMTRGDLLGFYEQIKLSDSPDAQFSKNESGGYYMTVGYSTPHEPASSQYLYLNDEEMANIINKTTDLKSDGKIYITQTVTPIGYVTKIFEDTDVTDYSMW